VEKRDVQQNPAQESLEQLAVLSEASVAHRTFLKISEKMCNKTFAQIHSEPIELRPL
jgi:hypothetical protein